MTDAPAIRSESSSAQEIDSLRSTVAALDAEIARLKAALRPFAAFDVPQEMIRKGYRGTVYATQQIPGKPATELTVDAFNRARRALETP